MRSGREAARAADWLAAGGGEGQVGRGQPMERGGGRGRRGRTGEHVRGCVSQMRRRTHMDQGHPRRCPGRSSGGESRIKDARSGERRCDKMEERSPGCAIANAACYCKYSAGWNQLSHMDGESSEGVGLICSCTLAMPCRSVPRGRNRDQVKGYSKQLCSTTDCDDVSSLSNPSSQSTSYSSTQFVTRINYPSARFPLDLSHLSAPARPGKAPP
ncbi:hypothetical protein D4764_05G0004070 [Takifugu flavidus]|uniref:Uncharacterized protein n=1 Tax=Takifugu flavidus TaxID=433684 RepID=A0A5C6N3L6_9TELE|nr:hypothetical protein D4764_05G0004070 [Takifugu flavidus]